MLKFIIYTQSLYLEFVRIIYNTHKHILLYISDMYDYICINIHIYIMTHFIKFLIFSNMVFLCNTHGCPGTSSVD